MKKLLLTLAITLGLAQGSVFAVTGTIADQHSLGMYFESFFLSPVFTNETTSPWVLGEVDNQGTYTFLDFNTSNQPAEVRFVSEFSVTTTSETYTPGAGLATLTFNSTGSGVADVFLFTGGAADGTVGSDGPNYSFAGATVTNIGTTATTSIDVGALIPALGMNATDFVGIGFMGTGGTRTDVTTPKSNGTTGLTISNLALTFTPPNFAPENVSIDTIDKVNPVAANAAPTAQPGENVIFDAGNLTATVTGSATDDDAGDTLSYTWDAGGTSTIAGGSGVGLASDSIELGLLQTGITSTTGTATLNLSVSDGTDTTTSSNLTIAYDNADPSIVSTGSSDGTLGKNVSATYSDGDLVVDGSLVDFEVTSWSFNSEADGSGTDFGNGQISNDDNTLSLQSVMGFVPETFAGDSIFFLLNDQAGDSAPPLFREISLLASIPEPATLAIWTMLGLAIGAFALRRRRK